MLKLTMPLVAAFCMATTPLQVFAESVTADDVTAVVAGWKNAREALGEQLTADPVSVQEYSGLGGTGTYYVVSLEGGGYVVTSGDTALEPVLAYSKEGEWVDDSARNPLKVMVPSNRGAKRLLNVQKVLFDETGFPVMGKAIGAAAQRQPSGE